jgi:hypothetical protein
VVAKRKRACGLEPAVGRQRVEVRPHLVDAGEPDRETVGHRCLDRLLQVDRPGSRLDAPDELLGRVDQHSGGLAQSVALEPPSRRIRCAPIDAREPQRCGTRPDRVAVHADQRDRMTGRRAVERRPGGKAGAGPAVLIPSSAGDPRPGWQGRGPRGDALRAGRLRREPRDVERQAKPREVHEVPVRVDQPRQHGAPAEIDLPLPDRRIELPAPPGERDAAGPHEERVDDAVLAVQGVDASVGEDHGLLPSRPPPATARPAPCAPRAAAGPRARCRRPPDPRQAPRRQRLVALGAGRPVVLESLPVQPMRAQVVEAAHPPLLDVLVPATRRDRSLARHDEAIEPGRARLPAGAETHRAIVTARLERCKS